MQVWSFISVVFNGTALTYAVNGTVVGVVHVGSSYGTLIAGHGEFGCRNGFGSSDTDFVAWAVYDVALTMTDINEYAVAARSGMYLFCCCVFVSSHFVMFQTTSAHAAIQALFHHLSCYQKGPVHTPSIHRYKSHAWDVWCQLLCVNRIFVGHVSMIWSMLIAPIWVCVLFKPNEKKCFVRLVRLMHPRA